VEALTGQGWELPQAQGNFVWLPLGEKAAAFGAAAERRALAVRVFPGEGVRVSVGEEEANSRFIDLAAEALAKLNG
jgi:histidinol-phosphate aminotransferase